MLAKGYIMLYRSLLDWQWYDDINTKVLFIHLLLTVNYEPQEWHGLTIERGQRVSSYANIAKETGLSVQSVRTAINHLISTGELTHKATSKYGLFTVVNYDKFQDPTYKPTNEQQTNNSQPTNNQRQCNKAKKAKKEKESNICAFFPDLWERYPNKRGKAKVTAKAKKEMDRLGYDRMAACIKRYIEDKPDWQQYQNGSTFFNGGYVDYLDNEYNQAPTSQKNEDSDEIKFLKAKLRE